MKHWLRRPADSPAIIGNLFFFFFFFRLFYLFLSWVLFWIAPHKKKLKPLRSFLPLKRNCTFGRRFPDYFSIGRLSMVFEVGRRRAKTSAPVSCSLGERVGHLSLAVVFPKSKHLHGSFDMLMTIDTRNSTKRRHLLSKPYTSTRPYILILTHIFNE